MPAVRYRIVALKDVLEALKQDKPAEPEPPLFPLAEAPKRVRGKHSLLTKEVQTAICNFIATSNCTLTVASRCAGVPSARFYRWMRLGRAQPKSKYGKFVTAIKEAEAKQAWRRTAGLLKVATEVRNAPNATTSEKLAGARLELEIHRATRQDFQPRERVTFNGKLKVEAAHSITTMSNEELATELERRAMKARKRAMVEGPARVLSEPQFPDKNEPQSNDGVMPEEESK